MMRTQEIYIHSFYKTPKQIAEEAIIAPPVTTGRERRTARRKYERSLKPY